MEFIKNINFDFDESKVSNLTKELRAIWSGDMSGLYSDSHSEQSVYQEPLSKRSKKSFLNNS